MIYSLYYTLKAPYKKPPFEKRLSYVLFSNYHPQSFIKIGSYPFFNTVPL
ncbi:MAG: hypothetical protein QRY71_03350 [Candidatus Rhabdochlamydia sp.]